MDQDHFWKLFAKNLAGEASEKEKAEIAAIVQAYPELSFAAQHVADVWALKAQKADPEAEEAFQKHLLLLEKTQPENDSVQAGEPFIQEEKPQKRRWRLPALIGAFLLLFVAAWFLLDRNPAPTISPQKQIAEVVTRPGTRTKLVLPDSSVVWLNAGSKLTYDGAFGLAHRNTTLSGEAFFDVKKSTTPFIIHTGGVRIKVLGTAFNVKSYPNEGKVETSLLRGRVEVTVDKRPGEKFFLKPNEKLTIASETKTKAGAGTKRPIFVLNELTHVSKDLILETSWVENKLVFQDESLEDVARKMERWYNVEIEIRDKALAAQHVGGGPFENETIEQALAALQFAFNFKYSLKGNHIVITR